MLQAARWFALASASSALFSIAVCQIFLALAMAALLFSEARLRVPPVWIPLVLFLAGTLISLAFSGHPSLANPQIRKFFVFAELVVVFSTVRDAITVRRLFYVWFGIAGLEAMRGIVQYSNKMQQALALGQNAYSYYVMERITGSMSHWMTFGGQQMFVFLVVGAYLLFAPEVRGKALWLALASGGLISVALLLGQTRTIWGATAVASLYLLWAKRPVLVLALPALLAVTVVASPGLVRTRVISIVKPQKQVDSNEHRRLCRLAGYEMIKAHPLLGVGPERVKAEFERYIPRDYPRPIPVGWYGHLHNIYIHYAAERGIPTMLALAAFLLMALWHFYSRLRALPPGRSNERFILQAGVAVVLATMAAGLFELNLGDSEVLTMFLVVVACGYTVRERAVA